MIAKIYQELEQEKEYLHKKIKEYLYKKIKDNKREVKFADYFADNKASMLVVNVRTKKIIDANIAALNFYGFTQDEISQKTVYDLNILTPKEVDSKMKKAVGNKSNYFEFKHKLANGEIKDGSIFPLELEVKYVNLPDENNLVRVVAVRDITLHKKAESDLQKQIKAEKEIARFQKDILELTMHIEDMREKERRKIALDLHDDLGQKLTVLNIDLAWLEEQIPKDDPRFLEKIKSMGNLLEDTTETVRRIVSGLRPSILDNLGLIAAIKWQSNDFEKTTGINCRVELISEEIKIDPELSINIFRMIQEALTNVTKHAQASKVIIKMKGRKTLKIEIIDNGKGINMKTVSNSRSFGLLGISERAKSCGGYMEILGIKGIGTELIINVPFTKMRKAND